MADFETIKKVQDIIEGVLAQMKIEAKVSPEDSEKNGLVFNITSPESYLLIGKQGANLYSLQMLLRALVSKEFKNVEPVRFSIDVDEYRSKREWFIKEIAKNAVEKVKMTGRSVSLEPMTSYERRLVHAYIQETFSEIISMSEGLEPHRKVVVSLKKLQ